LCIFLKINVFHSIFVYSIDHNISYAFRLLKSQTKVKEVNRELRNKTDEADEYKRKVDSLKNEKRRSEKTLLEVSIGEL